MTKEELLSMLVEIQKDPTSSQPESIITMFDLNEHVTIHYSEIVNNQVMLKEHHCFDSYEQVYSYLKDNFTRINVPDSCEGYKTYWIV